MLFVTICLVKFSLRTVVNFDLRLYILLCGNLTSLAAKMAEKEVQASKFVGKKTMLASNSQTEDTNSPTLSATISSKGSSSAIHLG